MNRARVLRVGAKSGVATMVAVWLASVSSAYGQSETHKLLADDGSAGDWFGKSVAVSGDTVLIAAPKVDYIGFDMGAAYVFRRNGAEWEQAPRLVAPDATLGDHGAHFGSLNGGVAIDGDTAVIGAGLDWLGPFLEGIQTGAAYVFRFNGSEWVPQQKLIPSDGEEDDGFGGAVAVSGNTIAIGSRGNDENGDGAGAVYLYEFDGDTWVERQKLLGASGKTVNPSAFGNAVALDGDRLLVGAPWDDTSGSDHGAAYTYHRQDGLWTLEQLVVPNGGGIGLILSKYGWSVTLDGEVMVIGSPGLTTFPSLMGAAFVFRFDGSNWVQEQKLLPPNFVPAGVFGYSVTVSGDTALIGDWQANDWVGAAHVFAFNGASWVATAELVGSDANDPDFGGTPPYFGMAVSLAGSTAAIAAPFHDSFQNGGDSGGVYIFDMGTGASAAALTSCSLTFGSTDNPPCDVGNLLDDDDVDQILRSQFGFSAFERNLTEVIINGNGADAISMASIETRDGSDTTNVVAKVKARNYSTNSIDDIAQYDVSFPSDDTSHTTFVKSTDYVDANGDIEVRLRYVAPATFTPLGFTVGLDQVRVMVD